MKQRSYFSLNKQYKKHVIEVINKLRNENKT